MYFIICSCYLLRQVISTILQSKKLIYLIRIFFFTYSGTHYKFFTTYFSHFSALRMCVLTDTQLLKLLKQLVEN